MPKGYPGTTGPCKKFEHTEGRNKKHDCIVCRRIRSAQYVMTDKGRISKILWNMRYKNKQADARDALQLQQLQERKRV